MPRKKAAKGRSGRKPRPTKKRRPAKSPGKSPGRGATLADLETRLGALEKAIGMPRRGRKRSPRRLDEVDKSLRQLEEYLIGNADRVENILKALQTYSARLDGLARLVVVDSSRDRMRLELDVMKNTSMLLALAGVEVDQKLIKEIDGLRTEVDKKGRKLSDLRKTKQGLDQRFNDEVRRFDVNLIYQRKEIPGYG